MDIEDLHKEPKPAYFDAHERALREKQLTYIDPSTGYTCFTEHAHIERGFCCGNKCRHCPFGHFHVLKFPRTNKMKFPLLLSSSNLVFTQLKKFIQSNSNSNSLFTYDNKFRKLYENNDNNSEEEEIKINLLNNYQYDFCKNLNYQKHNIDFIFWSGGKKSFSNLSNLISQYKNNNDNNFGVHPILVTNILKSSNRVINHDFLVYEIMDQANQMNLDLFVIPYDDEIQFDQIKCNSMSEFYPVIREEKMKQISQYRKILGSDFDETNEELSFQFNLYLR